MRRFGRAGPPRFLRWARGTKKNAIGRSRGGVSTKIHAVVTAEGLPLHVEITPGQQHEITQADVLLQYAQGEYFIADTAYDSEKFIEAIRSKGFKPVIPNHPQRKHHRRRLRRAVYSCRYRVEVFFHRLKAFRRVATRYEKTARNYLAIVELACAIIWLN